MSRWLFRDMTQLKQALTDAIEQAPRNERGEVSLEFLHDALEELGYEIHAHQLGVGGTRLTLVEIN